ncbi:hypothetical protein [Diaphorobacter nitroreducens]|uniref:hypothetical protein n=1 Tax=Diaphorobacter nitroreducens TaxID=164759 RepID=UPI0011E4CE38|nr:hypothetical protein [Diaphorobacter nitroreducens]
MSNRSWAISLLGVGIFASAASLYFAYQAGCAGDLKGGTLGDPQQALHYEGLSTESMLLTLFCFAALPILAPFKGTAKRALASTAIFLIALVVLILGGIQAEITGVQQCF